MQITYNTAQIKSAAQQSFQPVKAQCKMRNLIFLIFEAQYNSAIAEWHFCTKLQCNLT